MAMAVVKTRKRSNYSQLCRTYAHTNMRTHACKHTGEDGVDADALFKAFDRDGSGTVCAIDMCMGMMY